MCLEDLNVCVEFLCKMSVCVVFVVIGELFGSFDVDAFVVMRAYVYRFDFALMSIDDVMCLFLGGFKFLGEV